MLLAALQPLPWQQTIWRSLVHVERTQRLSHAFIFTGPAGIGKYHLASVYARYLLCERVPAELLETACGACQNCRLMQANTHPDYHLLEPQDQSKVIKIDQIRQLTSDLSKTAMLSGRRVVVIQPAEAMNEAAANALLKSLEEPGAATVFLLVTHQLSLLPVTIRSRCQCVRLAAPTEAIGFAWLQRQWSECQISLTPEQQLAVWGLAGSVPLIALQWTQQDVLPLLEATRGFAQDLIALQQKKCMPLPCVVRWQKSDFSFTLITAWLMRWMQDWLKLLEGLDVSCLSCPHLASLWRPWLAKVTMHQIIIFLDDVSKIRQQQQKQQALNETLLLENLLIGWSSSTH